MSSTSIFNVPFTSFFDDTSSYKTTPDESFKKPFEENLSTAFLSNQANEIILQQGFSAPVDIPKPQFYSFNAPLDHGYYEDDYPSILPAKDLVSFAEHFSQQQQPKSICQESSLYYNNSPPSPLLQHFSDSDYTPSQVLAGSSSPSSLGSPNLQLDYFSPVSLSTLPDNESLESSDLLFGNYQVDSLFPDVNQKKKMKATRTKIHKCPYCDHTSNRANNMREHTQIHNPNRPKPFCCKLCNRAFARKHDMKRHVVSCKRRLAKKKST
ncbi:hypothetical protein G6F43_001836 [Rhizopus delemar]|nr:hypothetical protein G6F43_001836 [Rhizopus delemar]